MVVNHFLLMSFGHLCPGWQPQIIAVPSILTLLRMQHLYCCLTLFYWVWWSNWPYCGLFSGEAFIVKHQSGPLNKGSYQVRPWVQQSLRKQILPATKGDWKQSLVWLPLGWKRMASVIIAASWIRVRHVWALPIETGMISMDWLKLLHLWCAVL